MNPFYFGEAGRALYGVHHPPRGSTPRSAGVVLCYPFAQEYMRAHRAYRQLSLLLSAEGFHVLRFDYTGTGDSAGDPDDMSLEQWDEDVAVAIEELIDTASVGSVWVVGLRLGGALALRAATHAGVRGVVLWDPIVSGAEQLQDTMEPTDGSSTSPLVVGGVAICQLFQRQLEEMDLSRERLGSGFEAMVAVSSDEPRYQVLRNSLTRAGVKTDFACVPSDGRWSYFDNWGSALIPQDLIRAIVTHLKGAVR